MNDKSKDDYYKSEEFKQLLERYRLSAANGNNDYFESQELTDIAEYLYNNGDTLDAEKALDYAISLHPGATPPLVYKARIALINEQDAYKAESIADKINDSLDLEAIYLRAEIMMTRNEEEEADRFLMDSMTKIDEMDVDDFVLDVAAIFAEYDLPELASKWLHMSEETDATLYKDTLASIESARGNYSVGEKMYEELLEEDPFAAQYWNSLASCQTMNGKHIEALTSCEYSLAINPDDPNSTIVKANVLFRMNRFEEALEIYKKHTSVYPGDINIYICMSNCMLYLGRNKESLNTLIEAERNAIKYGGSLAELKVCKAFNYIYLYDYDNALATLDEAEKEPGSNIWEIEAARGHVCLLQKKQDEAIKHFKKALKGSNHSPEILFRIGSSAYDNQYYTYALRLFNIYKNISPTHEIDSMPYLADCYRLTGHHKEYLECVKKAAEQNPAGLKLIMGHLFPPEVDPKDYYNYLVGLY